MKLRQFFKKMGALCTEDEVLAERISALATIVYDYEVKHPTSEFSMKEQDHKTYKERTALLFLFKHLDKVDTKNAERCEALTNLLALNSYKKKYKTEEFDGNIAELKAEIIANPIESVDSELPLEVVTMGGW